MFLAKVKSNLGVIALFLFALVCLCVFFFQRGTIENQATVESGTSRFTYVGEVATMPALKREVLSGVYTCLVPLSGKVASTDKCIPGMTTTEGKQLVLDFNLMSQTLPKFSAGQHFTASGVVTPIETLNTDQWHNFAVVGVFSVTGSVNLE